MRTLIFLFGAALGETQRDRDFGKLVFEKLGEIHVDQYRWPAWFLAQIKNLLVAFRTPLDISLRRMLEV